MITAINSASKRLSLYLMCAAAMPAIAQEQDDVHPYMKDGFVVHAGTFLPRTDVDIGVDGSLTGPNDPIDFDGQVGTRNQDTIFAAEIIWRFGEKWSLRGQYFENSRNASAVLEEDIEWEDVIFEEGSSVGAGTELELTRIFFARRFSNTQQHEYGFGLGLHRLKIGGYLTGDITVNGETFLAETRAVSAVAPLPNVGVWYAYSPSEKWVLDARLDWLDAEIGDYSGGLLNVAAGANYQVFKHFGIGLKYQIFRLKLDINKPDWHGDFELTYQGAYIYFSANWG